jgi:nicotinamide mononucleotide (NMN) deamidase PncC
MPDLTPARARALRLRSLLLSDTPGPTTPLEIVTWFGAMQSQDIASGLWSLGVRLPGWSASSVHASLERGEVLRTWPMRGTIHLVPSTDVTWMLELTGERALSASLRRRGELGLDMEDAERATRALDEALAGGHRLTRAAALSVIADAGISTAGQRGYHLLWHAAQVGVICIGPQDGRDQTFVLLREWAPDQRSLGRSEALVELAFRYFRSHGPATLKDFAGWTGLTLADARAGLAGNDGRLSQARVGEETCWLASSLADEAGSVADSRRLLALPGFDEFMLGYKDRSMHVPPGAMDRIVPGGNGVFRATLVSGGVVVATWRRTLTATTVRIEVEPLAPLSARQRASATRALSAYARYLDREPDIRFA